MVADDGQAALGPQPGRYPRQETFQAAQLVIDRDAQGLEGLGGRVVPPPPALGGGQGGGDYGGQAAGGGDGLGLLLAPEGLCDAGGKALLAIAGD